MYRALPGSGQVILCSTEPAPSLELHRVLPGNGGSGISSVTLAQDLGIIPVEVTESRHVAELSVLFATTPSDIALQVTRILGRVVQNISG